MSNRILKNKYIILTFVILIFSFFVIFSQLNSRTVKINTSNIIDHTCTDASKFTTGQIKKAASVNIYFEHASVGTNILDGIAQLKSKDYRFKYIKLRNNARGNPGAKAKIDYFYASLTNTGSGHYYNPDSDSAMMMKLCYIDNDYSGFRSINKMFEYYRDQMNSLQAKFPNSVIVWWTMPICTTGNSARDQYNKLIRNYCKANDKFLFDIADIECHDPNGKKIADPNGERLYPGYASDDGHLNSKGSIRVAQAFWIMAYKIKMSK